MASEFARVEDFLGVSEKGHLRKAERKGSVGCKFEGHGPYPLPSTCASSAINHLAFRSIRFEERYKCREALIRRRCATATAW